MHKAHGMDDLKVSPESGVELNEPLRRSLKQDRNRQRRMPRRCNYWYVSIIEDGMDLIPTMHAAQADDMVQTPLRIQDQRHYRHC